jgi:UDP-N-acetylglucosamine 3-dehydrogenase
VKVLVFGHGHMGKNHAACLRRMGHEVFTIDPDPKADADSIPTSIPTWIPPGYDAACIATPIEELYPMAAWALAKGMDVLVEKPGSAQVSELTSLHYFASLLHLKLFVGYTERFNPAVLSLKHHLGLVATAHHIGVRRLGRVQDRGHDPARDLAVHDFDVLSYLGFDLDVESAIVPHPLHLSVLMGNGTTSATIEASHLHPTKVRQLEVVGDGGLLRVDYGARELTYINVHGMEELPVPRRDPLEEEWKAFFAGEHSDGLHALRQAEDAIEANLRRACESAERAEAA